MGGTWGIESILNSPFDCCQSALQLVCHNCVVSSSRSCTAATNPLALKTGMELQNVQEGFGSRGLTALSVCCGCVVCCAFEGSECVNGSVAGCGLRRGIGALVFLAGGGGLQDMGGAKDSAPGSKARDSGF